MPVHRVARALAVGCAVLLAALLPMGTQSAPLRSMIELDSAKITLPTALTDAVHSLLAQRPAGLITGTRFRIMSAAVHNGWALVSVVALDGPHADPHAPDAGGLSTLVLARQEPDGAWHAALNGDSTFADLLAAAPAALVAPEAKAILAAAPAQSGARGAAAGDSSAPNASPTVNYKFPWPAGQSWGWWQGWHDSAHDLGTMSSDRRVLAAAEGVVSTVFACDLSTVIDLKHADGTVFRYIHLDKYSVDGAAIRLGAYVPQGIVLGVAKPDTWDDGRCGYTTQSPGLAHLHWIMPNDRSLTIDGWTIKFPTNTWTKDGVIKVPGYGASSALRSTNAVVPAPPSANLGLRQRIFIPGVRSR